MPGVVPDDHLEQAVMGYGTWNCRICLSPIYLSYTSTTLFHMYHIYRYNVICSIEDGCIGGVYM